jgi:UTP--glucose-1-phosphate uridylyltransferase
MGTRLLPATKSQPKEMLPIVDRPAIQYVVEEAIGSGIDDILIITGRGKRSLEDHFDISVELEMFLRNKGEIETIADLRAIANEADIFFVRQKEQRGLGHAVAQAKSHVGEECFAVLLGDDIFVSDPPALAQMLSVEAKEPGIILGIQEVPPSETHRYGIVAGSLIGENFWRISALCEKPGAGEAPSNLAITGRYILTPDIFAAIEQTPPGANGEIQLTDAINRLIGSVPVYGVSLAGKRYDIGDRLSYLIANIDLALNRPDMRADLLTYLRAVARIDF